MKWAPPPMPIDRLQRLDARPSRRQYPEKRSAPKSMRIWRRVVANAIDLTVYGLCAAVWHFAIMGVFNFSSNAQSEERVPSDILVSIIWISGWFLFGIVGDLLVTKWFNRTLGKALMGLLIVDARPDYWFLSTEQIVTRALTKAIFLYGFGVMLPLILNRFVWDGAFLWAAVPIYAMLLFLLLGVHREDRRGLHERFSGTELIRS